MKRSTFWLAILSSLFLTLLVPLSQSAVAEAAISHNGAVPATSHTGSWKLVGTNSASKNTASYVTSTTASTCVVASFNTGEWSFKLIWHNGGKNTVLYSSRYFTAGSGKHCSPTETIKNGHSPKVYDHIAWFGDDGGAGGTYSIGTN